GGVFHAAVGTLLITLWASLISIPVGLFTAIFLVEYADHGWKRTLGAGVTFLVDVMTGIPSIVAGLFGLAVFVALMPDDSWRGRTEPADDPHGGAQQRGDAAPGADGPARGRLRARRAQMAHHRQGGAAYRGRRPDHRHHPRDRPRDRRDRPAAAHGGHGDLGQLEHVRRADGDPAHVHQPAVPGRQRELHERDGDQ